MICVHFINWILLASNFCSVCEGQLNTEYNRLQTSTQCLYSQLNTEFHWLQTSTQCVYQPTKHWILSASNFHSMWVWLTEHVQSDNNFYIRTYVQMYKHYKMMQLFLDCVLSGDCTHGHSQSDWWCDPNCLWQSIIYCSYMLSNIHAAFICSCLAGTSNALAQSREHVQCMNGTHVLPRYGFLKVITLYPGKENINA